MITRDEQHCNRLKSISKHRMRGDLTIRIGNINISIESGIQERELAPPPAYRPFVSPGKTDISLRLRRGLIDTRDAQRVFDCPPIWTLYHRNRTSIIKIFSDMSGLERTLVLSHSLESADLYFGSRSDRFIDPFFGPTIELLMVSYLARGRGIIVHGCGIARNEKGILFVGESGAGKSTLAKLWHQEYGVEALSDDRLIVRKEGKRFWMYGTPWHGEARFGAPQSVEVERILFLKHGRENSAEEIRGIEAAPKLISCAFPPHWDAAGMAFTLDFLGDLAARVLCQTFSFKPDRSAIEFVIERLGN